MASEIRPLRREDEAEWRRLWRAYLAFYQTDRDEEVYATTWARLLDPQMAMRGRLAWRGDGPVGLVHWLEHASFWDLAPRIYLQDLFVDPEARGGGAGRALIEAVYADADAVGAARVYWLTAEDNAAARRLYDEVAALTSFVKYERR